MRGPDGWRYGRVRWAKSIKPSRVLHYFKDGTSLCGNHYDGVNGWYTEVVTVFDTFTEMNKCKKCKAKEKVLEVRE